MEMENKGFSHISKQKKKSKTFLKYFAVSAHRHTHTHTHRHTSLKLSK